MNSIRVAFPVSGAIVVQMGYYAVETVGAVEKNSPPIMRLYRRCTIVYTIKSHFLGS